jgi:phenylpropionate dioxygenase-like ring-hydroxylating dioxygenase large terminal subunit
MHATTDKADLRAVDRRFFFDDDVVALEYERVFARTWQFIAHASELPENDAFVTRRLGGDEVIVTRRDDEIRVLLNTCSHRGNRLCKVASGEAARFTCSYHGWTYDNGGRLVGVPQMKTAYGDDFDKDGHGLRQALVESFEDLVFATWSAEAPPLQEYLGDAAWYLEAVLHLSAEGWEVHGPPLRYRHRGNWKLESENFGGDGYHLPTTHRSMYETGVMGRDLNSEFGAFGHVVATPQGHCLRTVHLDMPDPKPYIGFPEELWPTFDQRLSPEEAQLLKANTVMHGCIFPNLSWIKVALGSTGEPDDDWTSYLMLRSSLPIDARNTEVTQWVLMPKDFPEGWRERSYRFAIRSHAPAAPFEADDIENFGRIAEVGGGPAALTTPFDYGLGIGVNNPEPGWPGPGNVLPQNASEHGQRALYRRYLDLMEIGS